MQKGVGLGGRTWNMGGGGDHCMNSRRDGKKSCSRSPGQQVSETGGGSLGCSGGGEVHARLDPNVEEQL